MTALAPAAALLRQSGITRDRLRQLVEAEQARRNLTAYSRAVYPGYEHAAHLDMIDAALMEATRFVETGGAEGWGRSGS